MKRTKLQRRTPLRKAGKKTREWDRIRRELKKRFMAAGITRCEVKLPQCWRNDGLAFCHTKRRADCTTDDLWKVVLGCAPCATALNGMNKHEEQRILENIINGRERQPC